MLEFWTSHVFKLCNGNGSEIWEPSTVEPQSYWTLGGNKGVCKSEISELTSRFDEL